MKLGLLVTTGGTQEGKLLEIKLPQFLIGRDPQCQLRPASPLISKRHCAIIQKDGKAFIRDFDSTNGTFINDEPVKGERELNHNDTLKIGPIQFKISIQASEPAKPSAATTATTPLPPTKGVAEKPSPAKADNTPIPGTTKKAPAGEEDDIAAMLLDLDDGSESSGASGGGVPEGSTVFDLKVPPELAAGGAKPDDKKTPPKASTGDTRSAAARILEKMTKRPRA